MPSDLTRIFFIGDIVGRPGRRVVREELPALQQQYRFDLVIANAENAAGGFGITRKVAAGLFELGIDVLTLGNHAWDQEDAEALLASEAAVLRPANFNGTPPGRGCDVFTARNGTQVWVANLIGRVFMSPADCPFVAVDQMLADSTLPACRFVDFHAEATSEKQAMGWHLNGRVGAVVGTHTHVPTADERILPGGTGFQTDAGMTGPFASVIGMDTEISLRRFRAHRSNAFTVARDDRWLCGTLFDLNSDGRCVLVERIQVRAKAERDVEEGND